VKAANCRAYAATAIAKTPLASPAIERTGAAATETPAHTATVRARTRATPSRMSPTVVPSTPRTVATSTTPDDSYTDSTSTAPACSLACDAA
jgi:hypothetical protein